MAEEGGNECRFVCKLCCKKFPCGKSLGGHMRSHVVANSAEFEEKMVLSMKRSLFSNESNGYGLRENPKKTWRAVDSRPPLTEEKVCKQCGKGFQSMKALCGHMACHSEKEKGISAKDFLDLDHDHDHDDSWTSDNQSDTETEENRHRSRASKARKCKKIGEESGFVWGSNGGSSVSEIDGQEQEELAKCLMMLSRDSGSKGGVNSVVESSDNNSVVVETKSSSIEMRKGVGEMMLLVGKNEPVKLLDGSLTAKTEDSDSGYFLDECGKGESDVSVDWFRSLKAIKNAAIDDSRKRKHGYENQESWNESARMVKETSKRSRYECFNCKKVFKSYQALGGHKPCNKRISESHDESGENSPDDAAYYTKFVEKKKKQSAKHHLSEKKTKNVKNKAHVCPFCDRVFKNGQALGGHKRSHFLPGHDETINRGANPKLNDLLDLNLPAPEADEDEGAFSW